jgi:hypothetical protein
MGSEGKVGGPCGGPCGGLRRCGRASVDEAEGALEEAVLMMVVSGETKWGHEVCEEEDSFEDSTEEPYDSYQDDFVGRLPLCVATK